MIWSYVACFIHGHSSLLYIGGSLNRYSDLQKPNSFVIVSSRYIIHGDESIKTSISKRQKQKQKQKRYSYPTS